PANPDKLSHGHAVIIPWKAIFMDSLEARIKSVALESIVIVPHDPAWPPISEQKRNCLLNCLPAWSDSYPLPAVGQFRTLQNPLSIYWWRSVPSKDKNCHCASHDHSGVQFFLEADWGDDGPFYAWFVKRD